MGFLGQISVQPGESFGDAFGGTPKLRAAFFRKIAEILVGGCLYNARCQLYAYTDDED